MSSLRPPIMRHRPQLFVALLTLPFVSACSSGGGGGGGGGDGEAALAALGFTPNDVADMADFAMIGGLSFLANDAVVPTLLGDPCPSVTVGVDNDASGHPDSIDVEFACTTAEGTVVAGTFSLLEYADPASFLTEILSCGELVAGAGTPEWGMQGTYFLDVQEEGSTGYSLSGSVDFAEFASLGQLVIELHTSVVAYPLDDGETTVIVDTNVCCTLPTDDSNDNPVGFVDTFVFNGPPPAVLALECQLVGDGTVSFDAFNGEDLLASGTINPAAPNGEEVVFD